MIEVVKETSVQCLSNVSQANTYIAIHEEDICLLARMGMGATSNYKWIVFKEKIILVSGHRRIIEYVNLKEAITEKLDQNFKVYSFETLIDAMEWVLNRIAYGEENDT